MEPCRSSSDYSRTNNSIKTISSKYDYISSLMDPTPDEFHQRISSRSDFIRLLESLEEQQLKELSSLLKYVFTPLNLLTCMENHSS